MIGIHSAYALKRTEGETLIRRQPIAPSGYSVPVLRLTDNDDRILFAASGAIQGQQLFNHCLPAVKRCMSYGYCLLVHGTVNCWTQAIAQS